MVKLLIGLRPSTASKIIHRTPPPPVKTFLTHSQIKEKKTTLQWQSAVQKTHGYAHIVLQLPQSPAPIRGDPRNKQPPPGGNKSIPRAGNWARVLCC